MRPTGIHVFALLLACVGSWYAFRDQNRPLTCDQALATVSRLSKAHGIDGGPVDSPLVKCSRLDKISIDAVSEACQIIAHGSQCASKN